VAVHAGVPVSHGPTQTTSDIPCTRLPKTTHRKAGGAYRGRRKALSPEKARELRNRAGAGEQQTGLARELGISRETLYQYLRADG
jgi:DNA invertase Pin-like site-specific DNA recombinase